jgi:hypothetical protein
MKANASGMPAKLAATPENVVIAPRIHRGVPSRIAEYAIRKPSSPPASAVTRLTSMLFRYAVRYGSSTSAVTLSSVKPPVGDSNAPIRTLPAGSSRKRNA